MFKKLICIAILGTVPAVSQGILPPIKNPFGGNGGGQDQQAAPNEGSIQDYLEMRAFAAGLYNQLEGTGDNVRQSAFKRQADAAVEQSRREDQELAFQMNTSAKSEIKRVNEDRYRVYSGLYDNPVVQALVNRVGQSVVSPKVPRLYTFKLIADPTPRAESLSTGTVWITTGMVALMKSKAELAYVLAHEAAHIYLDHHRTRILLQLAQEEYNKQLEENGDIRRARGVFVGGLVQSALGNSGVGKLAGQITAGAVSAGATSGRTQVVEWNRFEEDEADRLAFDWLLDSPADIEQVPKVFSKLRDLGGRDPGVTLGFLGRSDRVRERLANIETRLAAERAKPEFTGRKVETEDPDFTLLLAEVQRDNGVAAFHYDMLETARTNLEDAAAVKTQDPTVLYFYAKSLLQTSRTEAERDRADEYFLRAAQYDYRNQNYGTYLYRAIRMMTKTNATATDKRQAVALLKEYVLRYNLSVLDDQTSVKAELPQHLDSVYDYMARAGELKWTVDEAVLKEARRRRDTGSPLVDYTDGGPTRVDTTPKPQAPPPAAVEAPKAEPPKTEAPKPPAAGTKPPATKPKPTK
jgi:predicted Zn-dependent protease